MDVDIDANIFDVLLSDVKSEQLKGELSKALKITYLSDAEDIQPSKQKDGIIWGSHRKLFIHLTVKRGNNNRNIIFLIDTGAPFTYLCKEALQSLGIVVDNINSSTSINMSVSGYKMLVFMSPEDSHFNDINLLGSDFLALSNSILTANYGNNTLKLVMNND